MSNNYDAETPKPISRKDGERALAALKALGRVDIDRYLARIRPELLLTEPLGPTPDCFNVEQLEQLSRPALGLSAPAHLLACPDCTSALRLYRTVTDRALYPAGVPRAEFMVELKENLELQPGNIEFTFLLYSPTQYELDPATVSVEGILEKVQCKAITPLPDVQGSRYRANCVGHAPKNLLRAGHAGSTYCDWIRVSGQTRTGRHFIARELVQFHIKP